MLLLKVSETIVRPGKRLSIGGMMAGKCALEVNGVYITSEIFVQSKILGVCAAGYVAFEATIVCSGVLSK